LKDRLRGKVQTSNIKKPAVIGDGVPNEPIGVWRLMFRWRLVSGAWRFSPLRPKILNKFAHPRR
jgi:hypothetical protein